MKDGRIQVRFRLDVYSGVCTSLDSLSMDYQFKRHLKRVHPGITREQLKNFPKPDPKDRSIEQKPSKDRHIRRPSLVPGCRYFNVAVSRLSDHFRKQHAMAIDEHKVFIIHAMRLVIQWKVDKANYIKRFREHLTRCML